MLIAFFTTNGALSAEPFNTAQGTTSNEATDNALEQPFPFPLQHFEVDIFFNYDIPDNAKINAAKAKEMNGNEFKEDVKKFGAVKAEKMLDEELKRDVEYLKEKNRQGSEKFPIMKGGDHSFYWSPWT